MNRNEKKALLHMQRAQELITEEQMGFGGMPKVLGLFKKKSSVEDERKKLRDAQNASAQSPGEIVKGLVEEERKEKEEKEKNEEKERQRKAQARHDMNQAKTEKAEKAVQGAEAEASARLAQQAATAVRKGMKNDDKMRKAQAEKAAKEEKEAAEKTKKKKKENDQIYKNIADNIHDQVVNFECGYVEERLTEPYDQIGINLIQQKCRSEKAKQYSSKYEVTYGDKMRNVVTEILTSYNKFLSLNEKQKIDKASMIVLAVYDSRRNKVLLKDRILQLLKE